MPTFEEHCEDAREVLGRDFAEVHRWLDAFHGLQPYGTRHRRVRHHEYGIAEVIELFGEEAGLAARLHIVSDLKKDGWKTEENHFPKNEEDFVKMGLW